MPKRTQTKRRGRHPQQRKNRNHQNRPPTHRQGPTAQVELLKRAPLFNSASKRVRLPYYEYQLARTSTGGASAAYFFTANGCYDPNITGTGHQPLGFDTMMTYYEQYTVVASKITIMVLNNGTNAIRAGVALKPDTTSPIIGDFVENGFVKMIALDSPGYMTGAGSGGPNGRLQSISLNCDVSSYFGRKTLRELLDDTSLVGTSLANPSEQVYYAFTVWGGFFTDNIAVAFDVVIEYDVIFWEPRQVPQQLRSEISKLLTRTSTEKKTSKK